MEPLVLLNQCLEIAKRRGTRAAEALVVEKAGISMAYRPGLAIATEHSGMVGLELRLYLAGGKAGMIRGKAKSLVEVRARLEGWIAEALEKAEASEPDPLAAPADRYDPDTRGFGLLDRRLAQLKPIDRRELIEANIDACHEAGDRIAVDSLDYHELSTRRSFASNRGVSVTESSSRFDASCRAHHEADGRVFQEGISSRIFANLVSIPFGLELGKRLIRHQQRVALPEGSWPLFVPPPVMVQLLNAIAPAFVASEVHAKRSFVANYVGKRISAPRLHLIDDPGLPGALETRAFDDRGVPPIPVVLIREGKVTGLYYDLLTARQQQLPPTGHIIEDRAERTNIVLRSGTRSRNVVGMDIGDYLVLDGLHTSAPLDIATGMFDSTCDALVYRKNAFCGAVQGLRLRIAIPELLGSIREIADDQSRYANVDSCTTVFDGVTLLKDS